MTHAELLRKDAELAMREGGMYYSGECLSRMASVAESLEAENAKLWELGEQYETVLADYRSEVAKLRELVRDMHAVISDRNSWWDCMCKDTRRFADRMRELGVEVNE